MNHVQAIRLLELETHELRQELGRLRHKLQGERYHVARIEQARKDALLLALWASAGIPPSRRYAKRHNMSETRWESATALLRLARVCLSNEK